MAQAASYQALKSSFWDAGFPWFKGASFWDVSVSLVRNSGEGNNGFSPIGKTLTTRVLQSIFDIN